MTETNESLLDSTIDIIAPVDEDARDMELEDLRRSAAIAHLDLGTIHYFG